MSASARLLGHFALGGLAAFAALFLFARLGARANDAYEAATPIRSDVRSVTVLFDRAGETGVLREGWGLPIAGQGAWSTTPAPILLLPTSTAAGDVELTLVMASAAPGVRARPLAVWVGDHPVGVRQVGVWAPRTAGDETVRFIVPRALRAHPYQLLVTFDLAGGSSPPQAIKVVSASSRILRD